MTSILAKQKVSKRSLTLNKSFILSLTFHLFLVFGITFTTFYTIPVLENSPIINVKFANSSQDVIGYDGFQQNESLPIEEGLESMQNIVPQKNSYQARKVKKLESNSLVNTEEAVYLNLWQRNIESIGDEIIASADIEYIDSKVQVMATIDSFGNLIKSEVLISSGNIALDKMALNILIEAAPFAPFDQKMLNEYSVLEIVRDWNFSPK
ncbi:MAG: hypothetical protein CBE02_03980 [Gammaproteobacteria bacterium TMED242]|nr:MAG: hypothetical protein CBE02_03980 [Gammaproteobacteria bacterium TMED242]|tara:strand:- start:82 stop:708 length:627 start_codon:yes stop_codon:yes gene_type:complete